jgi:cytochrome c oxidase cbb3-type subunit 3
MQVRYALAAAAITFAGLTLVDTHTGAQVPPQTPPAGAPQTPPQPAGRGQGRGRGTTFPAQQRPPGDPAVIARGKGLYDVTCAACHGMDLRGGQLGGVNLLRSQLVLSDQAGELIYPVVRDGRIDKGMPPLPLPEPDVKAIAEYIHSVAAAAPGQGAPPRGEPPVLNILVGDPKAGEAFFTATCTKCHSASGDLKGIATRVPDAKALQNLWVSGGGGRGGRGGGGRGASAARTVTVAVTLPAGQKVEGRLVRIDDFLVTLAEADGTIRTFRRAGAVPRVEIRDPLAPHRALLATYTDKNMHDVTAFLATLK